MESGNLYMIPFLSKELNLLGYSPLPYTKYQQNGNETETESEKGSCSSSNSESHEIKMKNEKISFNSREMIRSLVAASIQLVNDMKLSCQNDRYSDDYDKIAFENRTLQKKVEAQQKELEKKMRIISDRDEKCRQLNVKVSELEGRLKNLEKEKQKNAKQNQLNEDIMKHQKKKSERDLFQLHKVLYSEKNMLHTKYLPQNFDIVQEKQPDFKKLWSQVKYSSVVKKEEALKKAVCIFQENNEILLEENSLLKTLLFFTIQEINTVVDDICCKLNISSRRIEEEEVENIFMAGKGLRVQLYKDCLGKQLDILTHIFDFFNECSFSVDDNIFISLTDIVDKIETSLKE